MNPTILEDLRQDLEKARTDYENLAEWGIHFKLGLPCTPLFPRLIDLLQSAGEWTLTLEQSLNQQDWQAAIHAEQQAYDTCPNSRTATTASPPSPKPPGTPSPSAGRKPNVTNGSAPLPRPRRGASTTSPPKRGIKEVQ